MILGIVVPAAALGFYAVAVTLAELFWLLPDSIGKVLFNRIAREHNSGFQEEMLCRVHRIVFWVSFILMIVGAVAVTYVIIPYGYGGKYLDSITPFLLLLPGTLLYIPAKITTKLLSSTGKILETSYATASGSVISIILYFILIPKFGIIGAAYAASIGYIFISIFCIYYVIRYYDITLKDLFLFSKDDLNWIMTNLKKISPKKINTIEKIN